MFLVDLMCSDNLDLNTPCGYIYKSGFSDGLIYLSGNTYKKLRHSVFKIIVCFIIVIVLHVHFKVFGARTKHNGRDGYQVFIHNGAYIV